MIPQQTPYNDGEICAVSPSVARIWVKNKVAVYVDVDAVAGGLDKTSWDVGVKQLKPQIAAVTDRDRLVAMLEGEKSHPDYEGGRLGVIKMIAARLEEVGSGPPTVPEGADDE